MGPFQPAIKELINSSLTNATQSMYQRHLQAYTNFVNRYFPQSTVLPISLPHLLQFIGYLYAENKSYSTIRTIISALNFNHQLSGGEDITNNFIISKLLRGVKKSNSVTDLRLPITPDILENIVKAADSLYESSPLCLMLQSMYMLAFYAFLRIGEITVSSPAANKNLIQLSQVSISPSSKSLSISFEHYKHKATSTPFVLHIPPTRQPLPLTTVLIKYLAVRGPNPGPLFLYKGKPVGRSFFVTHLNQCLQLAHYDVKRFKTHSFRIGAATTAVMKGYSQEQVQCMGRWKSAAYKKYIRVQSISL